MKHLEYRGDIDGLRAVAVICVVVFHVFPRMLTGGFIGVDIFFVISGFLISSLIFKAARNRTFTYVEFYGRRFRRIFPALITVLATSLAYGWFNLLPDAYRELGRQTLAGAGFTSNLLFWTEAGYFGQYAATKPLLHLWSLGVEEQFYLICPFVILLACVRMRRPLIALGSLAVASFIACIVITNSNPSSAFYLPVTRFWELFFGTMLACVELESRRTAPTDAANAQGPSGRSGAFAGSAPWVGLALIALALRFLKADSAFPGWWALLPTLGTALVIYGRTSWLNRTVLSSRPLVFVGLISYPLYLWHWVVLVYLRVAVAGASLSRWQRLGVIALSALLAILTYELIEKPLRSGGGTRRFPAGIVCAMAVVAAVAALVVVSDGGAFRYPTSMQPLAAVQYDRQRELYEDTYRGGRCFLNASQGFADLGRECIDPDAGLPLLVLWGDSHAASLFPGLLAKMDETHAYRIAQFTASACPPVIGFESGARKHCTSFNDAVFAAIKRLHPAVVVIEGHWSLYAGTDEKGPLDPGAVRRTLLALREAGLFQVVVFGNLPTWQIDQPDVVLRLWQKDHRTPSRTNEYLDSSSRTADDMIRLAAAGTGADFVSPMDLLCGRDGCLISADPARLAPVAWDHGHLSREGSRLLIDLAWPNVQAAGLRH